LFAAGLLKATEHDLISLFMTRMQLMCRPSKRWGNTKVKPTPCYESVGQSLVRIVNVLFRAGKWLRKNLGF